MNVQRTHGPDRVEIVRIFQKLEPAYLVEVSLSLKDILHSFTYELDVSVKLFLGLVA